MKAILMSIQSKWLAKILNGEKTVELRKRFPKDYRGWVYLYCTLGRPYLGYDYDFYKVGEDDYEEYNIYELHDTRGDWTYLNGKVVCRFWVANIEDTIVINYDTQTQTLSEFELSVRSRVSIRDLNNYFVDCKAIDISKLEIFDKPKELGEFSVERYAEMPNGVFPCYEPLTKAPQSWQYVEVEQ